MLTRELFAQQLHDLGVRNNDTLYIRASLGALGRLKDVYDIVIGGLEDAVGPQGTLLAPAFNKIQTFRDKEKIVIDDKTTPYSGAVSKQFLKHPNVKRSTHPSHSFAAIGPKADQLLAGHDENAPSFLPIQKLSELDGKMILIGCNNESPGFSTVHVAQYNLGLTQKHLIRHFLHAYIRRNGEIIKWKPQEAPGCSASFDKFYPAYIRDQNLITGFLGQAYSLLIPSTRKALATDTAILKNKPTFSDCGRADCLTCGLRTYQAWRIPITLVAAPVKRALAKG